MAEIWCSAPGCSEEVKLGLSPLAARLCSAGLRARCSIHPSGSSELQWWHSPRSVLFYSLHQPLLIFMRMQLPAWASPSVVCCFSSHGKGNPRWLHGKSNEALFRLREQAQQSTPQSSSLMELMGQLAGFSQRERGAGALAGLGLYVSERENGPGKSPGSSGAVPQEDAKRTRGFSGRVLAMKVGLETCARKLSLCSCLSQGKITWHAHLFS